MHTFEDAFRLTMHWEGGDTLHEVPGDPGGLTKWGVSQRAHPEIDVRTLTEEEAMDMYRTQYWMRMQIWGLPGLVRWDAFDYGVNAGVKRASEDIQRAINICVAAKGLTDSSRLRVDGRIGPNTRAAAEMVASWYDGNGAFRLQQVYRALRTEHYVRLAERGMAKFIHGWLNRVDGRFTA